MARVAQVLITGKMLQHIITKGWRVDRVECTEGLPEGARLLRSSYDTTKDLTVLLFEHETFDDVPSDKIPMINVAHKITYTEASDG